MPLSLTTAFAAVPDPRRDTGIKLHLLTDILTIAACAIRPRGTAPLLPTKRGSRFEGAGIAAVALTRVRQGYCGADHPEAILRAMRAKGRQRHLRCA